MDSITLITSSLLLEILLALNSMENAPESQLARTQAEVVIERICATQDNDRDALDCAVDVLVAIE